ncbi:multidrug transporter, partial [Streptomyces sp. G-G2]|nr:multidrug transporter [Streptomyces sp. G-G2]
MPLPRSLLPLFLATAVLVAPGPTAATATAAAADTGTETARTTRQIAPGVRLRSFDRLEHDRWLRVDELDVDLDTPGVRAEYLGGPLPATVADSAARHPAGPGRRAAAAVNGDFFDIRGTGAPLGPGIRDGRLLHAPAPGAGPAAGFGPDGAGEVLFLGLAGTVTLPGDAGAHPLAGYNTAKPPAEGYLAYTADWTWGPLPAAGPGPAAAADVRDGQVAAVRPPAPWTPPGPGTTVLVGRGAAAARVAALRPGDPVTLAP